MRPQYNILTLIVILTSCSGGKDYPVDLSEKIDTIDLHYMGWACDCADWALETDINKFGDDSIDSLAIMSIFIEAANSDLVIPDEYKNACCGNTIRFIGQFYNDWGISRTYEIQFEKPDFARVFRYIDYELLKPYTAWDFNDTISASTKVIR